MSVNMVDDQVVVLDNVVGFDLAAIDCDVSRLYSVVLSNDILVDMNLSSQAFTCIIHLVSKLEFSGKDIQQGSLDPSFFGIYLMLEKVRLHLA